MICGHLESVAAVDGVAEVRVCAVVEEHFDHDEAVIAADGMLEGCMAPLGHVVGVGAAVEGEEEAFFVVPVGFAGGKPGEGTLVAAAGVDEDFDDGVVVGFRGVVAGLLIVGIGAVFEEEAGKAGMLRETGGGVDDGFLDGAGRVVDVFGPPGVGAGSGVEQRAGGGDECIGTGFVEAEIAGEGEVGEGVPLVRTAGGGGEGWVLGQEFADGGFVGEDGGGVNVGGGDVRVAGEDEIGVFERAGGVPSVARDAGHLDEGVDGVGQVFEGANDAEGFKVGGELGPRGETVFAGEDELRVGEGNGGEFLLIAESGVVAADAVEGRGHALGAVAG